MQLTCYVAKGDLPMTITWLFNEKPIFAHLGIVIIKVGDRSKLLSIPSIKGENSGNYTCIATNLAGVFTHNSTLNVHGKFNGLLIVLNCLIFIFVFLIQFIVFKNILSIYSFRPSSSTHKSIFLRRRRKFR